MSQHNTPINHTLSGGGSLSTVFLETNIRGIEPLSFQKIILRAKKSMIINVIDFWESTSATEEVCNYIVLLDVLEKANLWAFITGDYINFGSLELQQLNDSIF